MNPINELETGFVDFRGLVDDKDYDDFYISVKVAGSLPPDFMKLSNDRLDYEP